MAQEALGRGLHGRTCSVSPPRGTPLLPPPTPASSLALLAVLVGPLSSKPLARVGVVPTGTSGGGEFIWVALSKTGT